jgi:predicted 3-demethylubiquinone-9 3-methyltransferase (glyoxalase superfamily)
MRQKIQPSLWFDNNCEAAMNFYVSVFPDSKITDTTSYPENAADEHLQGMNGKILHGEFELYGQQFVALDGGPEFAFNPSKSFIINCESSEEVDDLWQKLSAGDSKVLMELAEYPFSPRYGWVQDQYGLSWQIMQTNPAGDKRPKITPSIMFIHDNNGKAEEAMNYYVTAFKEAKPGIVSHYPAGMQPDPESSVAYEDFQLFGEWFAAMDSGRQHDFDLNEAVSFIINCDDQAEIDYYWDKLSAVPEAEQCGWCKDKYGVSWQVIPGNMGEFISTTEALEAMMKMHKIDIAHLQQLANN